MSGSDELRPCFLLVVSPLHWVPMPGAPRSTARPSRKPRFPHGHYHLSTLKFESAISSLPPPAEASSALPHGWVSGFSFVCPVSPGNKMCPSVAPQRALVLTVLRSDLCSVLLSSFAFGDPFLFSMHVFDDPSSVSDFFLLKIQSLGTCLFRLSPAASTGFLTWVALPKDKILEVGPRRPAPCSALFFLHGCEHTDPL